VKGAVQRPKRLFLARLALRQPSARRLRVLVQRRKLPERARNKKLMLGNQIKELSNTPLVSLRYLEDSSDFPWLSGNALICTCLVLALRLSLDQPSSNILMSGIV